VRLGELTKIQVGFQFKGPIKPAPDGNYRVVQVGDLAQGQEIRPDILTRIAPERDLDTYLVRPGDAVFVARGSRYYAVPLVDDEAVDIVAPNQTFILRTADSPVDPAYLAWFMDQPAAQNALRTMAKGTHVRFVAVADLAQLDIPVPPLATQRNVVRVAALLRREQELLAKIAAERQQLVSALCLGAVQAAESRS
jgi:restriction endonuclease S subunit